MLTRSPVPPGSVDSSSRGSLQAFHYASASRHPQSPSRVSLLSRRRSSSSASASATAVAAMPPSPARALPKHHGASLNPATQSTPMASTPIASSPPRVNQDRSPSPLFAESLPAPPPPPEPKPMMSMQEAQLSAAQPALSGLPQTPGATQHVSPNKRKSSSDPTGGGGDGEATSRASAAAPSSPATVAKRARPDTAPPKLLAERYELCAVEDMVVLIANMLGELIETNDRLALESGHLTRFHSRTAPGISVLDYLHRLAKHATLTPPLLLSMVYYIDRLCISYPDFTINTLTVHRFLITAATVAAKGLSDSFWNNSTYARVGGVKLAELKLLELEFLYRVDWKIVPNPEVLVAYYRGLVERCASYILPGDDASSSEELSDESGGGGEEDEDEYEEEEEDVRVGEASDKDQPPRHSRSLISSRESGDMSNG